MSQTLLIEHGSVDGRIHEYLHVYTSYFGRFKRNLHEIDGDVIHVAISRFWPKNISLSNMWWYRELAPPTDLLNNAKSGNIGFNEYIEIYMRYLDENKSAKITLLELMGSINSAFTDGLKVVFYCFEKDYTQCHRSSFARRFVNTWNLMYGEPEAILEGEFGVN